MARLADVVVDCRHAPSLARFWAAALEGYDVAPYDDAEIARLRSLGYSGPEEDPGVIRRFRPRTRRMQRVCDRKRLEREVWCRVSDGHRWTSAVTLPIGTIVARVLAVVACLAFALTGACSSAARNIEEPAGASDAAATLQVTTTTIPAPTTLPAEPTTTTAPPPPPPPPRVVTEPGATPFATFGEVVLLHPSARVERVGFHQSNHDGARELTPTTEAVAPMVLESRERETSGRTAADVVIDPDAEVRSPVTGTVKRAGGYTLYCKHRDDFAVIAPDAAPGLEVKILHIDGVQVRSGQRVVAGETVIAGQPTRLPFESQIDEFTAAPAWPHVHIEVVDPTIKDRPSPGGGCS